jgi:type II secretory pathway pseudopilin PulG
MDETTAKPGPRLINALVLIVIFAASLALIIPVVNSSRETQRRTICISRMRSIGLAFANYSSANDNRFPPSASVSKSVNGALTVGGWSHLVRLLPFMEYNILSRTLLANGDPEDTSEQVVVALTNTQLAEFLCPSGLGRNVKQAAGITNYKAMGASARDSLKMAVTPNAKPPYGVMSSSLDTAPRHPDGAIFPGSGIRAADVLDGLSYTIIMIETIDQTASRWAVGKEATLVGLPQASSPTGEAPGPRFNCFTPPGFDAVDWGDESSVAKAGLRTFLSYDFSPRGADEGKYEDPGFAPIPPAYGPSSMHPDVVICSMGDGSTRTLSKRSDAACVFFMITKNNSDSSFELPPPLDDDKPK